MLKKYDFDSRDGADEFDRDLDGLCYTYGFGVSLLSITDAFDNYYNIDRGIYFIAIDLKLCLFNMFVTIREMERLKGRNDLIEIFTFHNKWIQFIAVYRSFFDKFMNLVVKAGHPESHKDFDKAKSKLKAFKKIALKQEAMFLPVSKMVVQLPKEDIEWMSEFITFINNNYRTAEIHGAGSARKWVFKEADLRKTPYAKIKEFVDHLSLYFQIIGCIVSGKNYAEALEKQRK